MNTPLNSIRAARPPYVFAVLLLIFGLGLAVPGAYLLTLGGSAYYVVAGLGLVIAATLVFRGDSGGVLLFGTVLIGTVAWSVWEVGLDAWALLPRVAMPLVMGLWLALPIERRGIRGATGWFPALVLLLAIGLGAAVGVGSDWNSFRDMSITIKSTEQPQNAAQSDGDWQEYGRDKAGTRFTPLAQINAENVSKLQLAWTFRTGIPTNLRVSHEVTPLKIRDRLYLCTGDNQIIALDAETGQQVWRFDPHVNPAGIYAGTCRGVAYYRAPGTSTACPERILTATIDHQLIAVNLETGEPCADFGERGRVDLSVGMGPFDPGYYFVTSAPAMVHGKAVIGGWVTDGQYVGEPSGVIRGFDAITGKLAWAWDLGRPDQHGEPPSGETYTRGTPNSWAPLSTDETLGLVFVPTGNATPDYFGGFRSPVEDAYSSAVVAIDADTGAARWKFQTTHHDLWDYDVSSQPTLVDLPGGVPALIQATKRGEVFVLDRRTGQPIVPVEERPVAQDGVPEEHLSPTQPFSRMPSFAGPPPTEQRMWGITPFDQLWCRIKFRQARFEGTMTPLVVNRPTVTFPGYLGGMDWGGVSVDLDRDLMVVNTNRIFNYNQLMTRQEADRLGIKPFSAAGHGNVGGPVAQAGTPYAVQVSPFLSPLAVPCTQPPFGMISAVDLKTAKLVWSKPFGTGQDSGPLTIPSHLPFTMGVPSIGGPIVTRSGLTFIAASQDDYLRAYDTTTGRELWRARLPAGGQATPMAYRSEKSGREFIVIVAGGHGGLLTKQGDYVLAYALPQKP